MNNRLALRVTAGLCAALVSPAGLLPAGAVAARAPAASDPNPRAASPPYADHRLLPAGRRLPSSGRLPSGRLPPSAQDPPAAPGGLIAFTRTEGAGRHLWTIRPDGSDQTRLTTGAVRDEQAAWSPDGRRIAFIRSPRPVAPHSGRAQGPAGGAGPARGIRAQPTPEPSEVDLLTMTADGEGEPRDLTASLRAAAPEFEGFDPGSPTWSPDGRKIAVAFTSTTGDGSRVVVIDVADPSSFRILWSVGVSGAIADPTWSPDGRQIAVSARVPGPYRSIWLLDAADGGDRVRLTDAGAVNDEQPAWSPGGARIAFVRSPVASEGSVRQVFVAAADGSGPRRLTDLAPNERENDPAWSPDGRRIALSVFHPSPAPDLFSGDAAPNGVPAGAASGRPARAQDPSAEPNQYDIWLFPTRTLGAPGVNLTDSTDRELMPHWQPVADLSVTKAVESGGPEPRPAGEPLTYTLTVANHGPGAALDVTLTDRLPTGVAVENLPEPCTLAGRTVTCLLGTVLPAIPEFGDGHRPGRVGPVRLSLRVRPRQTGELVNRVEVTGRTVDPDPGNNTDTVRTLVPGANLVVTATAAPDPVERGRRLAYTVTVANRGPETAGGAVVTGTWSRIMPAGAIESSLSCPALTNLVRCELGDLPPDTSRTFSVTVRPTAAGELLATFTGGSGAFDPVPDDNRAVVRTEVVVPPGAPVLRLEPTLGQPGFTALAVGDGFPPDTDVALRWFPGIDPAAGSWLARTDAEGRFSLQVLTYPRDQIGPRLLQAAAVPAPGGLDPAPAGPAFAPVTTEYLVTPSPVAPDRFVSRR